VSGSVRRELQEVMTSRAGVLRSAEGLAEAAALLDKLSGTTADVVDTDAWETTNLLTLSTALVAAAEIREETRGSHWREDFPGRDDERWSGHLDAVMVDGATTVTFTPAPATDGATP
jgi:L-aspartate oxidase